MQRTLRDAMLTAGSALALVLLLVLVDDRVRLQISAVFDTSHPGDALAGLGGRASQVMNIVFLAARTQSLDHAPLVVFAVAAAVLTLFMLRT
jgi:hypothetical protein